MKYTITNLENEHTYYEFQTATFACGFHWGYAKRPERKRIAQRLLPVVETALNAVDGDSPSRLVKALERGKNEFPGLDWSPVLATALTEGAFRCALHMLREGYSHNFYCEHLNLPGGISLGNAPPAIILAFQFIAYRDQAKRELIIDIVDELLLRGAEMNKVFAFEVNGNSFLGVPKNLLEGAGVWGNVQSAIEHRELNQVVQKNIQKKERELRI